MSTLKPHNLSYEKNFRLFLKRISFQKDWLEAAKAQKSGHIQSTMGPLYERIKPDELIKIFQYFTAKSINCCLAMHLPKETTGLCRSLHIIYDKFEEEFALILETKSKFLEGKQRLGQKNKKSGGSKTGKDCWRIDKGQPILYFNLVSKFDVPIEEAKIKLFKTEIEISREVLQKSRDRYTFINTAIPIESSIVGEGFCKKYKAGNKEIKKSCYALKANGDLEDLLDKQSRLSHEQKHDIIEQLLLAVFLIHKNKVVHQDIKTENILFDQVNKNGNTRYYIRLTDFGLACDYPNKKGTLRAVASYSYASPEIFLSCSNPKSSYHRYFFQNYASQPLGKQVFVAFNNSLKSEKNNEEVKYYKQARFQNDLWACGITMFKILFQDYPEGFDARYVNQCLDRYPLVKRLLSPEPRDRGTIDGILREWHHTYFPQRPFPIQEKWHVESSLFTPEERKIAALKEEALPLLFDFVHHLPRSKYCTPDSIQKECDFFDGLTQEKILKLA